MPKAKKRNGFFFLMRDVREEYTARGQWMSNASLQNLCSEKWMALTPEQKEEYNARAKQANAIGDSDLERKFDSLGVSFAANEAKERSEREENERMKKTIQLAVEEPTHEELIEKSFYLIHVNYYFTAWIDSADQHCPCEIAVLEFSLSKGVIDTLHYIIAPGEIPLGKRGEAKTWADMTHGIPLGDTIGEEHISKEHRFVKIFADIVAFLRRNQRYVNNRVVLPPVYTMPDCKHNNNSLKAVQDALAKFSRAANEDRNLFRVYPVHRLFYHLQQRFVGKSSDAIWEGVLVKDMFCYTPDLGCEFHEDRDLSIHCSFSKVKRWMFTICDHVCEAAGVKMIPGRHLPVNTDVSGAISNRTDKEEQAQGWAHAANHEGFDEPPSSKNDDSADDGFTVVGGRGRRTALEPTSTLRYPESGRARLFKK